MTGKDSLDIFNGLFMAMGANFTGFGAGEVGGLGGPYARAPLGARAHGSPGVRARRGAAAPPVLPGPQVLLLFLPFVVMAVAALTIFFGLFFWVFRDISDFGNVSPRGGACGLVSPRGRAASLRVLVTRGGVTGAEVG